MAAAFCDKLMAYDVEPEEWRKLDVSIGDGTVDDAAGDDPDRLVELAGRVLRVGAPDIFISTQVSHKDLAATISGMDSPGRLGVQDSDQAQAAGRYNYDHAAEKSFYAPKKNGSA